MKVRKTYIRRNEKAKTTESLISLVICSGTTRTMERRKIAISNSESNVATRLHRVICMETLVLIPRVTFRLTDLSAASILERELCRWTTSNGESQNGGQCPDSDQAE